LASSQRRFGLFDKVNVHDVTRAEAGWMNVRPDVTGWSYVLPVRERELTFGAA